MKAQRTKIRWIDRSEDKVRFTFAPYAGSVDLGGIPCAKFQRPVNPLYVRMADIIPADLAKLRLIKTDGPRP